MYIKNEINTFVYICYAYIKHDCLDILLHMAYKTCDFAFNVNYFISYLCFIFNNNDEISINNVINIDTIKKFINK